MRDKDHYYDGEDWHELEPDEFPCEKHHGFFYSPDNPCPVCEQEESGVLFNHEGTY